MQPHKPRRISRIIVRVCGGEGGEGVRALVRACLRACMRARVRVCVLRARAGICDCAFFVR